VIERKDAHVPDFAEVASDVKAIIADEKSYKQAEVRARALLERAIKGEDLAVMARAEKLRMEQSGFFARTEGFMPRTGIFVGDKEVLFSLASGAYYPEVVSHNGRHYILRLSGAKEADEAAFEPRKEELRARLLAEKQDEALGVWLKGISTVSLRVPLKIALFPDLFVRAEMKMLTYCHICCAFHFRPSSTSEKI